MCLGELWRVCLVVGPVGHLISDAFNVIHIQLIFRSRARSRTDSRMLRPLRPLREDGGGPQGLNVRSKSGERHSPPTPEPVPAERPPVPAERPPVPAERPPVPADTCNVGGVREFKRSCPACRLPPRVFVQKLGRLVAVLPYSIRPVGVRG